MASIPLHTPTKLESVALFRHSVVGDLVVSDLPKGALQEELQQRAQRRYRPPGAQASRTFHWKTLQRWLFAARRDLAALQPASRERGFALALTDEQRQLLLDIRDEHPTAAADLILDAVVRSGALEDGLISLPTLRRLFAKEGAPRVAERSRATRAKDRRRWEADRACRIWHTDVCHVWRRKPEGGVEKAYVHAILDDHTRYVVAMRATVAETENDLLDLLVEALLRYPAPEVLYTDNGSTYRGDVLALALDKLGIKLAHAAPYDPQARGKMERFWRTLRQRLLDHDTAPRSLHDLNAALLAWLDADYHRRPHGGLLGDMPGRRFRAGLATLPGPKSAAQLARALEVTRHAKVRKDATFSVNGRLYEVRGRHLGGQSVDVVLDPFTDDILRVVLNGEKMLFNRCNPKENARRARGEPSAAEAPATDRFARIARVLQAAREVSDDA